MPAESNRDAGYGASLRNLYNPGAMDLDRLANALEIFGSLAPGAMPLHHMQLVLFIKEGGQKGVTYGDIERRFRLSNASASRSVNALSETVRHRKTALGLVEIIRDAEEGRRYRVRLTAKGSAVVRSIEAL